MTSLFRTALSRTGAAVLILLLAGGSAFAAASTLNTVPVRDTHLTAEASETAEPSETPEPSESAEPSESPSSPATPDTVQSPDAQSPTSSPSSANVDRIVANLATMGIDVTADDFQTLAGKVGVGGAVRALLFSQDSQTPPATATSVDDIVTMFQNGEGWGQIKKDLGLSINPGIGSVMSNGHGNTGTHGKSGQSHGKSGESHGNSGH